jgi:hypothetical protein
MLLLLIEPLRGFDSIGRASLGSATVGSSKAAAFTTFVPPLRLATELAGVRVVETDDRGAVRGSDVSERLATLPAEVLALFDAVLVGPDATERGVSRIGSSAVEDSASPWDSLSRGADFGGAAIDQAFRATGTTTDIASVSRTRLEPFMEAPR